MASLNTCAPPPSIHLVVARPPELPWRCARHRLHALVLASVSLGTRLVGAACGGGGCAGVLGHTVVSRTCPPVRGMLFANTRTFADQISKFML